MLETHVSLPEDPEAEEGTVQSYIVEGFGVYSEIDGLRRGFYVDEVSFSSERREFDMQEVRLYIQTVQDNSILFYLLLSSFSGPSALFFLFSTLLNLLCSMWHQPALMEYQFIVWT